MFKFDMKMTRNLGSQRPNYVFCIIPGGPILGANEIKSMLYAKVPTQYTHPVTIN